MRGSAKLVNINKVSSCFMLHVMCVCGEGGMSNKSYAVIDMGTCVILYLLCKCTFCVCNQYMVSESVYVHLVVPVFGHINDCTIQFRV